MIGILEQTREIGGVVNLQPNTFIGGVASTIPDKPVLASALGILESNISYFAVVGNNIEARINVNYEVPIGAFSANSPNSLKITSFYDLGKKCTRLKTDSFIGAPNLSFFKAEGVTYIESRALRNTPIKNLYFPNLTVCETQSFSIMKSLESVYIGNCIDLGGDSGNNLVFYESNINAKKVVHASLATNNGGNPDGDLSGNVVYVQNYTIPDAIIDLTVSVVYGTSIKLNWTLPTSLNGISHYEIYVDGIFKIQTTDLSTVIFGLTNLQTYNFTVKAIDTYYNRSLDSNIISQQINGTDTYLQSLLSYYRLDNDLIDKVNEYNGTGTAITYLSGKSGNAANFNGTSSFISIPDHNDFSFTDGTNDKPFSIAMAVKFNSTGNGWLISKRNSSNIEWQVYKYSGKLIISLFSNNSGAIYKLTDLSFTPIIGQFYHFGFTYSGTGHPKIYIDKVLQSTTNANEGTYVAMLNTSAPIIIGRAGWFSGLFFNGAMDCLPIFNKELSQSEITNIFDEQNAGNELI